MNSAQTTIFDRAPANTPNRARLFYASAATMLLVLVFLGFQLFYLHGRAFPDRPLTPSIRNLVIIHAIAMSLWALLLVVQPLLVVNGKYRVHMTLGKVGAVLAICVVVAGSILAIASTRIDPSGMAPWNLTARQFMVVPLFDILTFGGFVATGIANRRRSDIHRPMMLLAMLTILNAATDRTPVIASLYAQTQWGAVFGPFLPPLLIGVMLLILKSALTRSFDRYLARGLAVLIIASAGIMKFATTQVWDSIASFII